MQPRPACSLILVCYRSSAHVGPAVASFRRELARCGLSGEIVLVDHSEDNKERSSLSSLGADLLICQENRGFAAGVNAGIQRARGEVLFVGNPDISFAENSLSALVEGLRAGFDVVGPQFVIGPWSLPRAESQLPFAELARLVSSHFHLGWKIWWLLEIGRNVKTWTSDLNRAVTFLSGALMAFPRTVWDKVGPFDESYFLYFEESDWLLRAKRLGCRAAFVPKAKVTHHWAHVAKGPQAAAYMMSSRRRYLAKNFGWIGRLVASTVPKPTWLWPNLPESLELRSTSVLWLLSPTPLGVPAAGLFGDSRPPWDATREMIGAHPETRFYLAAMDPVRNRFLGMWTVP